MIVSVENNTPNDLLRVEIELGNVCNFKCWYCFPGANEGDIKPAEFDLLKKNLSHLLDHYIKNGKSKFDIFFSGGEPTLWTKLGDLCEYLKGNYNVLISMSSNGSRTLRWWEKYGKHFDKVVLSCHYEYVDVDHYIKVADCLYEQRVIVSSIVLMDPNHWSECESIAKKLKTSKHRWNISLQEIISNNIVYTNSQKQSLLKNNYRWPNPFWFLKNHKHVVPKVKVVDEKGNKRKVNKSQLVLERLNNFKGWECNIGVESISIQRDGRIAGGCGEFLYGLDFHFNINDPEFRTNFNPDIKPALCTKTGCWCVPETNLTKQKI